MQKDGPLNVVVVGGGVAALETIYALQELAGDRVSTTVLTAAREFVDRPMSVREPFARAVAARYELAPLVAAADAKLVPDGLKWLDHQRRIVHTTGSTALLYDEIVLAVGARPYSSHKHVITLDPATIDHQLHGVIQDMELGLVRKIAFVVPDGRSWPLPLYEVALMTAARAYAMQAQVSITLLTPEKSPLAIFGSTASDAVHSLLADYGIEVITGAHSEIRDARKTTVPGRLRELNVDCIIALPELRGPAVPGVPHTGTGGFLAVDSHCRVKSIEHVFAAGDITDFPVKHGAIAAQQALTVAHDLAGISGMATTAPAFEPTLYGVLLGASDPLYMRARMVGGTAVSSEVSTSPLWDPSAKIRAPHLTQALNACQDTGILVAELAPT
jgi:sulfide:quinone oxidoreductase